MYYYFLLFCPIFLGPLFAQNLQMVFKNPQQEILGELVVGSNESSNTTIFLKNHKTLNILAEVGRITAVFSHKHSDWQQAAQHLETSHFNWINLVVGGENAVFPDAVLPCSGPSLETLWVDPLPFGNQGHGIALMKDDLRPFFWSEETHKDNHVFMEILGKNIKNQSIFTDHPRNAKGSSVFFETYFVAVKDSLKIAESKQFYVLGGFSWKSDTNFEGKREPISQLSPIQINVENHFQVTQRIQSALNQTSTFETWKALSLYSTPEVFQESAPLPSIQKGDLTLINTTDLTISADTPVPTLQEEVKLVR